MSWRNHRHTQAEYHTFKAKYLRERMPHRWADPTSIRTTCTTCGAKYTAVRAAGQRCPKRRRPNRYRIHLQRAWLAWRAERPKAPTMDGKGILAQLETIEEETKRAAWQTPHDDRWWKYSREARRYRRLMCAWWALPASETSRALDGRQTSGGGDGLGWITAGRNRLLKQARASGQRVLTIKGCTYTFNDQVFPELRASV